ncbi:MAG: futalosine hydrolase [Bacteroidales bacterium]|nr:futalosine hydrolase [Bacteroidales bacterium]
MNKTIVIATATENEADFFRHLALPGRGVSLLVTGIGGVASAWSTMNYFAIYGKPDMLINTGIAGSFSERWPVGSVVVTESDTFGDLGIDDNGTLKTLFEAGLGNTDDFPFKGGRIYADSSLVAMARGSWPVVNGVTVNRVTGSEEGAKWLVSHLQADIETMEGAALYYVCRRESVPVLGIRAISNMAGLREREKWDIKGALAAALTAVEEFILKVNGR